MSEGKKITSVVIPCATVFISSACIMVIELVAGRLIARHLGSSLYTWTSVIGVVLAGITLGNALGGRIADRYPTRKALARLFILSSLCCLLTAFISNIMGNWPLLWQFGFLFGVISYVFSAFFLPSCALGAISPVVAKMALDKGLPTGRTVGDIYACGAAGSILGTFATGYYLIAAMGTVQIIWAVSGILFGMGMIYSIQKWGGLVGVMAFFFITGIGILVNGLPGTPQANLLSSSENNRIALLSKDTQYSYVSVDRIYGGDIRTLRLNNYVHGVAHTKNPAYLRLDYSRIFAAITKHRIQEQDKISVLCIGGGAFVIPRYIDWMHPNSQIDIVEIDPVLTEIAKSTLGFEKKSNMRIFHMDARNYVQSVKKDTADGREPIKYDFIYGDAFGDNAIPFQLVTKEFNDCLSSLMGPQGLYMVNVIDIYEYGRFLGAYIHTLEKTFPHVMVMSRRDRETNFVVVASKRKLDLNGIETAGLLKEMDLWRLSPEECEALKQKTDGLIFTDNYAPVDNLISPVAAVQARKSLANQAIKKARELRSEGKFEASIEKNNDALSIHPPLAPEIYREIGHIYAAQKKWEKVVETNKKALASEGLYKKRQLNVELCLNTWDGLKKLGKPEESTAYLEKALAEYRFIPETANGFHETTLQLCYALLEEKQYDKIVPLISRSVDLDPLNYNAVELLAFTFIKKNNKKQALRVLQKAAQIMGERNHEEDYFKLQTLIKKLNSDNAL